MSVWTTEYCRLVCRFTVVIGKAVTVAVRAPSPAYMAVYLCAATFNCSNANLS